MNLLDVMHEADRAEDVSSARREGAARPLVELGVTMAPESLIEALVAMAGDKDEYNARQIGTAMLHHLYALDTRVKVERALRKEVESSLRNYVRKVLDKATGKQASA